MQKITAPIAAVLGAAGAFAAVTLFGEFTIGITGLYNILTNLSGWDKAGLGAAVLAAAFFGLAGLFSRGD
jgi:cell division protein FtsX